MIICAFVSRRESSLCLSMLFSSTDCHLSSSTFTTAIRIQWVVVPFTCQFFLFNLAPNLVQEQLPFRSVISCQVSITLTIFSLLVVRAIGKVGT